MRFICLFACSFSHVCRTQASKTSTTTTTPCISRCLFASLPSSLPAPTTPRRRLSLSPYPTAFRRFLDTTFHIPHSTFSYPMMSVPPTVHIRVIVLTRQRRRQQLNT